MNRPWTLLSLLLAFFVLPVPAVGGLAGYEYPAVKQIQQVEQRFGRSIADEFKWMENPSDPDLWNWIEAQQELTLRVIDQNLLQQFYRELKATREALALPPGPSLRGGTRRSDRGLPILERFEPAQLLEPNEGAKYTVTAKPVYNGDLLRLEVTRKDTGALADVLLAKFYEFVRWEDEEHFLYVTDFDDRLGGSRPALVRHKVGRVPSDDTVLFRSAAATHSVGAIFVEGTGQLYVVEETRDGRNSFVALLDPVTRRISGQRFFDSRFLRSTEDGGELVLHLISYEGADRGKVRELRVRDGIETELLAEQEFITEDIHKVGEDLYMVLGHRDADGVVALYRRGAGSLNLVQELGGGTVTVRKNEKGLVQLTHETYESPKRVLEYRPAAGELKIVAERTAPVEVVAKKLHYTSTLGNRAAIWVLSKKGQALGPQTPMILYGYGGFNINVLPVFNSQESLPWIARGGALAVVTLPGGVEYGESWAEHARVGGRVHSFDSFAEAGRELIRQGLTSRERLGMMGASNGGVLVTGTLQRHADLFKAAIPHVGVQDLLNFPLFTAGKYWTIDYGYPFAEADFNKMFGLSPYHNLTEREYPATLVMTAEFDDRVVPMHSFKYAARLQQRQKGAAPVLLYTKEWGGHSRASGSEEQSLSYVASAYSFFAQQLGLGR